MMKTLDLMRIGPVIPVIVIDQVSRRCPLARALVAGGVSVLEPTLRTPVALAAIEAIAEEGEGAIVGVDTITKPEDFEEARKAGAVFGVSPRLTPDQVLAPRLRRGAAAAGRSRRPCNRASA